MNHFLALLPDDATRERLTAIQDRLRAWELPARWMHPQDLHLTLCFIGPCSPDEAQHLPAAVDDLARTLLRPHLRLSGLAGSGNASDLRQVYAVCEDRDGICATTHLGLCETLGLDAERHYTPHITVCRPQPGEVRPRRSWPELFAAFGQAEWGPFVASEVALCRATDRIPRYDTLARWAL